MLNREMPRPRLISAAGNLLQAWKELGTRDAEAYFEWNLDREVLYSERMRALIIMGFFLLSALWFFSIGSLFGNTFPDASMKQVRGVPVYVWLSLAFMGISLYEAFFAAVLTHFIRRKKNFPVPPRFFNALVEVSIPTITIYLASFIYNPFEALFLPAVFMYFLFIILSAFRLNLALILFTGGVAAAEYLILSLHLLHASPVFPPDTVFSSPGMYLARTLILLAAGIATAFVSQQIRKRMINSLKTLEDRNRIVGIFGQHVTPEVVDRILAQEGDVVSEERKVCIMFLDIRNFTGYSENRDAGEVIAYLNYLFDFMIEIVNARGGIINKFLGDGFMAVFGAPVSTEHDIPRAVEAGREILRRLESEASAGNIPPTRIGIGLHAGMAMTGNVGSPVRREYTVMGGVVNVASRIEQLNKTYGSAFLVSEAVAAEMESLPEDARDLGPVEIRGLERPVRIYRLV